MSKETEWDCVEPTPRITIPKAAPKEAARETPRVEGDAKGFLRTFCMTIPDTAKAAPANMAERILVMRMFHITTRYTSDPLPMSALNTSPMVIGYGPKVRAYMAINITKMAPIKRIIFL